MALINPMQPTWKRSSLFSPRPENRWITESTSRRLPSISSSLASSSPALARRSSSRERSPESSGSWAVFMPQMSTLPCKKTPPLPNGRDSLSLRGGF